MGTREADKKTDQINTLSARNQHFIKVSMQVDNGLGNE